MKPQKAKKISNHPVAVAPKVKTIHRPGRTNGDFAKFSNFDYGSEDWSIGTQYATGGARDRTSLTGLDLGMFLLVAGLLAAVVVLLCTLSKRRRRKRKYRNGYRSYDYLGCRMA
ncbi:hypothetical protein F5884DRAFT_745922 [Xylogone sp. PMI_703]|nr:hypothetical protein F5884DRAFT_745922 [Xylogone sp. PMI_703]